MDLLRTEFAKGDPSVLHLEGEIDISTSDQLRAALADALVVDPHVVIDMTGVTFFDASGLRVVLEAAASLDGSSPITLLNARRVARVLELVGLGDLPSIVIRDGDSRGR